jgi:hypothetical protein
MELTDKQQKTLDVVLDCIIPPSPERSLPGASQVGVWSFIVRLASDEAAGVVEDLQWLDAQASALLGQSLASVDYARASQCLSRLREAHPGRLDRLARLTMSCYYQHDVVLAGIGMEPRPPFPLGHTVAPGDLTLLEPVKQRGPIFRRV